MNWKFPAVLIIAGLSQLLVFGYLFASFFGTFFFIDDLASRYLYLSIGVLLLSILPIILIIILLVRRNDVTTHVCLIMIAVYLLITVIICADISPRITGFVVNKYTEEPVIDAEVCYRVHGSSLFGIAHPVGSRLGDGCVNADEKGYYTIPRKFYFDPYSVLDGVSIDVSGGENLSPQRRSVYVGLFVPSQESQETSFALTPTNYTFPDCSTIKNESVARECMAAQAYSYAFVTANESICEFTTESNECTAFVRELFEYTPKFNKYGVCTIINSGYNLAPYLYWERNATFTEETYYVMNGDVNIGYTCYVVSTDKPMFILQDPTVVGFYTGKYVYSSESGPLPGLGFVYGITEERINSSRILGPELPQELLPPPPPNPEECEKIENAPATKMWCYHRMAIALQNPTFCEKTEHDIRDMCYLDLAKATGNKTYCNNIVSTTRLDTCIQS